MNKSIILLVLTVLVLWGCVSAPDPRAAQLDEAARYMQRGVAAYQEGRYATAASLFSRALSGYQSIDDVDGILRAHINLAETSLVIGNLAAAESHAAAASCLVERDGFSEAMDRVRLLEASIARAAKRDAEAVALLEAMLAAEALAPELRGQALASRAAIAVNEAEPSANEQLARYREHLERAKVKDPSAWAIYFRLSAQLGGMEETADQLYARALDLYKQGRNRQGIASTLEAWAAYDAAGARYASGIDRLNRALYIRMWLADRDRTREDLALLAEMERARGNEEQAARAEKWVEALADPQFRNWQSLQKDYRLW